MSFPCQKKPRQNLSLDLSQPILIKPPKRSGLKHTNSVCLPVTKSSNPTTAHMTSRLMFSNQKSSSHPTINHTPYCLHTANDTSLPPDSSMTNQHSVKMVTSMEVANRISSSSESEEDGEGWLLLNERSKPWPEPDLSEVNITFST